jgi:hypothetical protein
MPDNENYSVTPTLMYLEVLDYQVLLLGIAFSYRNFSVGVNFSNLDALVFQGRYEWNKFSIGYSYDLNTARFYFERYSAHELTLSYLFNCKNKRDTFVHPFKKGI